MADPKPQEVNLFENVFTACLAYTLEFAIIYFVTTVLIFSELYPYVWSIQTVGLLAIFHLIAIPLAYFGVREDKRILVLSSILLCCVWFILIIVYAIVFSVQEFEGNDFKYRSLHHIVLTVYCILDLIVIVFLSVNIISEKSHRTLTKSLRHSPDQTTNPDDAWVPNKKK